MLGQNTVAPPSPSGATSVSVSVGLFPSPSLTDHRPLPTPTVPSVPVFGTLPDQLVKPPLSLCHRYGYLPRNPSVALYWNSDWKFLRRDCPGVRTGSRRAIEEGTVCRVYGSWSGWARPGPGRGGGLRGSGQTHVGPWAPPLPSDPRPCVTLQSVRGSR